jgi:hypothetical protein
MTSWRKAILFGFLVWLVPFVAAIVISPLRESWRSLFESIMPVVLSAAVGLLSLVYFGSVKARWLREGLLLGVLWFALSVLIDLPLMLGPPLNMPFLEYVADIGVTYLMIPIITTAMAAASGRARGRGTGDSLGLGAAANATARDQRTKTTATNPPKADGFMGSI